MLFLIEGGVGNAQTESNVESLVEENRNATQDALQDTLVVNEKEVASTPAKKQRISDPKLGSQKESQKEGESPSSTSRCQKTRAPDIENEILKHMKSVDDALNEKSPEIDKDEVVLFSESLVPQLRNLPIKKFRLLKMDIEKLIYHAIYDE